MIKKETGWLVWARSKSFVNKSYGMCWHVFCFLVYADSLICSHFYILMSCGVFPLSKWNAEQFLLSSLAAVLTSGPCDLRLHIIHLKDHSLTLHWQSPGLSSWAPWLLINELVLGLFGSRIINQQKSPLTSVRSLSPSTEGLPQITGSNTLRNHDGWTVAAWRFIHGNKCPFKQVGESFWIGASSGLKGSKTDLDPICFFIT